MEKPNKEERIYNMIVVAACMTFIPLYLLMLFFASMHWLNGKAFGMYISIFSIIVVIGGSYTLIKFLPKL